MKQDTHKGSTGCFTACTEMTEARKRHQSFGATVSRETHTVQARLFDEDMLNCLRKVLEPRLTWVLSLGFGVCSLQKD